MTMPKSFIEEWDITLPNGTQIKDEIQYSYVLSPIGVEIIPQKNRRIVTDSDGNQNYIPVPEDFEQNRKDLCEINEMWKKKQEKSEQKFEVRQKDYQEYTEWIKNNVSDSSLVSLLSAFAPKRSSMLSVRDKMEEFNARAHAEGSV